MTLPFRRRSDAWSSPHDRARARAVERVDGPLDAEENAWLDRHLEGCDACRSIAESYQADRGELRSLARQVPEPPRDLWARTAAAIEREAATPRAARPPLLHRLRPSPISLGAISGLLVVAVVFGASLLGGRAAPTVPPQGTPAVVAVSLTPTISLAPQATPLAVPRGGVDWIALGDDGQVLFNRGSFSAVCKKNGAECPTVRGTSLPIEQVMAAEEVVLSPNDKQLVVVDHGGGNGTILVVPVPTPASDPGEPTSTPPVPPTATPSVPASPIGGPSEPPTATPAAPPSGEPSVTGEPTTTPPPTPPPSNAPIAIAANVVVVGETAFSEDGTRFAFSARPADGSHGPDIFVWTSGDATAVPITDDHASVFSGWLGDVILGSRAVIASPEEPGASAEPSASVEPSPATEPSPAVEPSGTPAAEPTVGQAFVIDPATGIRADVEGAAVWRPILDPTGTLAVYWDGTIELDETGVGWQPAEGRLVVGPWPGTPELPDPISEPGASGAPAGSPDAGSTDQPAAPAATVAATAPLPTSSGSLEPGTDTAAPPSAVTLVDGPIREWDARWDELGDHLGVWIADADDPTIGWLTLYEIDPETRVLDPETPLLGGVPAVPGFAIDEGHLAWATKDGEDGRQSVVKVVAWTENGIGEVETQQGEGVVVVQR